MSESDMARRLARVLRRPTMQDKSEEFLVEMIEEATEFVLDYTHRTKDLGEVWDGLITEIAIFKANQLGIEGTTRAGEGALTRMYADGIPKQFTTRLNQYRLIIGVSVE